MRMDVEDARSRLRRQSHGVLCTLHPARGPDPQPVVYTILDDEYVGIPIDRVKPKASARLQRQVNLESDPRGALLVEHWNPNDWSKLWWVRAHLDYVTDPEPALTERLATQLAATIPQYVDRPFHRVLVCRISTLTGWAAAG